MRSISGRSPNVVLIPSVARPLGRVQLGYTVNSELGVCKKKTHPTNQPTNKRYTIYVRVSPKILKPTKIFKRDFPYKFEGELYFPASIRSDQPLIVRNFFPTGGYEYGRCEGTRTEFFSTELFEFKSGCPSKLHTKPAPGFGVTKDQCKLLKTEIRFSTAKMIKYFLLNMHSKIACNKFSLLKCYCNRPAGNCFVHFSL